MGFLHGTSVELVWSSGSQSGVILSCRDIWQCLEKFLVVTLGVVVASCVCLLASSGQRSGMLLNILHRNTPIPTTKNSEQKRQ